MLECSTTGERYQSLGYFNARRRLPKLIIRGGNNEKDKKTSLHCKITGQFCKIFNYILNHFHIMLFCSLNPKDLLVSDSLPASSFPFSVARFGDKVAFSGIQRGGYWIGGLQVSAVREYLTVLFS